jgi:Cu/Ag efflux pump CusA
MSKNKKKKEKIIYYDDNSTIADMSNVTRTGKKEEPKPPKPPSSAADRWRTYWSAVGMMIKPMFFALGIIALLYVFIMLLIGGF